MQNLLVFLTTVTQENGYSYSQIIGHVIVHGDINEGRKAFFQHKNDTEYTDVTGKTHKLSEVRLYRAKLIDFFNVA